MYRSMKLDLLTNATAVDDAIRFSSSNMEEHWYLLLTKRQRKYDDGILDYYYYFAQSSIVEGKILCFLDGKE
jgi:hypothetical protein